MKLHENKELFVEAIKVTAEKTGLSELYIEKDYWVTFALHAIFTSEVGQHIVFKGGTALAKCFHIIQRFSEDIDLVVLREENDTGNSLKRKLRNISKIVSTQLPEIPVDGVTNKMGMIRKTAHQYHKHFTGDFGQARDFIILESSWLGNSEPFTTAQVSSYISEMMLENEQSKLIEKYGLQPFPVSVLDPKRTLCEKIMSLVRFSHTDDPISDLNLKIRHLYDLHKMLQNEELQTFFVSDDFDEMLLRVANDDVKSFRNNNLWLQHHPKHALIFSNSQKTWRQLRKTYQTTFSELVYGSLPDEREILKTIQSIARRLEAIKWKIIFD